MAACVLLTASRVRAQEPATAAGRKTAASLQQLVDKLRSLMAVDRAVTISIVPVNPKAASMIPPSAQGQPFRIAIEAGFLDVLSNDELSAVIAHELGHVWVATHHPYLQTEALANSIALRVVSRASLAGVYTKVWARDGSTGDLLKFLGPPSAEAQALAPNR